VTETNVFQLTQPGTFSDPLTEVLRNGARTLLGQTIYRHDERICEGCDAPAWQNQDEPRLIAYQITSITGH